MIPKLYLKTVIDKIEENISGKVSIEQLSSECFLSPRQLYRDFYSLTGHSVNEYVRKRRLSNALALVKHSGLSLSVIANNCGYATLQSFCKSVKAAVGQTPLEYKQSECYYYFPVLNNEIKQQITVSTESIPQTVSLKHYSSQLCDIENRAVSRLLSLIPDYKKRIFGRNGK